MVLSPDLTVSSQPVQDIPLIDNSIATVLTFCETEETVSGDLFGVAPLLQPKIKKKQKTPRNLICVLIGYENFNSKKQISNWPLKQTY